MATVDKKQRNLYYEKLYKMRGEIPVVLKSKISDDHLRNLTMSLMDGAVFEIIKELEEIQQLNERSLLNKRIKIVHQQNSKRSAFLKNHKDELELTIARDVPVIKLRHKNELDELNKQLTDQLKVVDQEVILELDQIVAEQQSTLHQAAVPFFKITTNPQDIQLQSYIIGFIQRLYHEICCK